MIKHLYKSKIVLLLIVLLVFSCKKKVSIEQIEISEDLQLIKLNDHSYIHISKITLSNGNKFPCNGFVYINKKEAYVFDTPSTDQATSELINWLQNEQKVTIKGVVFNHFHNDCTEGIEVFKEHGVPSIANKKTAALMLKKGYLKPDQVFENSLELHLQNKTIINRFFGEAHTLDNITSYFPDDQIIFGGCMIKSLTASKGNLADANTDEWSNTVLKIKKAYPKAKIVIPGHGDYGDQQLLDYTISLFKTEKK